ncbi:hypothetical protein GCM10009745_80030 [Kribbella yunnanensis]|uniref:Uncharacterized protein n=1 Tax=Kribbella yunnanensis TaxID=190194 RepID=A0ABN2J6P8_9ACTN
MSLVFALLGALAVSVVADEFLGWVTPICCLLLRAGARRLPPSWRERYAEEWQAELLELPNAPYHTDVVFSQT